MGVIAMMTRKRGKDAVTHFCQSHGLAPIDLEILASLPPDHVCTEKSGGAILRELVEAVFDWPMLWDPPAGLDHKQRSKMVTDAFDHINRRSRSIWGVPYALVRWRNPDAGSGSVVTTSLDKTVWQWVQRHVEGLL